MNIAAGLSADEELRQKAKVLRLLILDVDGVLTDGSLWIGLEGEIFKCFNARDGIGLKRVIARGIEVVLVTGRTSGVVNKRAKELGIEEVYQGVKDKGALAASLVAERGYSKSQVCAVGDDLPDLPMLAQAGIRVAVADAVKEVKEQADIILSKRGGKGAIRELCDWILEARQ